MQARRHKRRWHFSRSTGYYYFGDGVYDYAHCFRIAPDCYAYKQGDRWGASWQNGHTTTKTLAAAKRAVERGLKVRRQPPKKGSNRAVA